MKWRDSIQLDNFLPVLCVFPASRPIFLYFYNFVQGSTNMPGKLLIVRWFCKFFKISNNLILREICKRRPCPQIAVLSLLLFIQWMQTRMLWQRKDWSQNKVSPKITWLMTGCKEGKGDTCADCTQYYEIIMNCTQCTMKVLWSVHCTMNCTMMCSMKFKLYHIIYSYIHFKSGGRRL